MMSEQLALSENPGPTGFKCPDADNQRIPDWARRSDEDLLRYIFVCPHVTPELDELLRR